MACGLTNSSYPNYLSSILLEINVGNDQSLKACACSLKSYVDVNSKPYSLPICISSVNGVDNEIYTTLNNIVTNNGGYIDLQPIDPQKIMELQYKYKSFTVNVIGYGYPPSATCDDEGASVDPSNFSEGWELSKSEESKKHQVCNMFLFSGGSISHGYLSDCDEQYQWNSFGMIVPAFGFHYYFFMDTYVDPECGDPGPILYQGLIKYPNAGTRFIQVNDYFFEVENPPPPDTVGYGVNNATNLIAW